MTRRPVNVFEDMVTVDSPDRTAAADHQGLRRSIRSPFRCAPGTYRLNVVAKDVVGGNMNNYEMALNVPHLRRRQAGSSSLILADLIEKVPTRSIGTGQFVIGATKVRPRMNDTSNATKSWESIAVLQF